MKAEEVKHQSATRLTNTLLPKNPIFSFVFLVSDMYKDYEMGVFIGEMVHASSVMK